MRSPDALFPQVLQSSARSAGDWRALLDMLPSSFELMAPVSVARQGLELASNGASSRRFVAALMRAQVHLRDASLPVLIQHGDPSALTHTDALSRPQRRWLGQLALELYFTQIFRSDVAILDLWPSRFGVDEAGDAAWSPRPLYVRWDPRFCQGLRDVYAGFFLDDETRFDHGVFQLGLGSAADVLVGHFGEGNQRSVRFGIGTLRDTMDTMAEHRRPGDRPLHSNFVAFGLYLIGLHALLESLDMRFDVRAAFMRSYPGNSHR